MNQESELKQWAKNMNKTCKQKLWAWLFVKKLQTKVKTRKVMNNILWTEDVIDVIDKMSDQMLWTKVSEPVCEQMMLTKSCEPRKELNW